MRHDAKLGLALGMLVVGFAVAFCFPRQPERADFLDEQAADLIVEQELEFLPIRAYQPAASTQTAGPSRTSSPDRAELTEAIPETHIAAIPKSPPPPPLAPLTTPERVDASVEKKADARESVKATATIAQSTAPRETVVADNPPRAAEASPDAPLASQPATAPVEQSGVVPKPETSPTEQPKLAAGEAGHPAPNTQQPETYQVQPGDTLSGIAARYLGDASKYQELFEANRDKLSSPHKLPLGVVLTLPSENPPQQVAPELPRTMIAEKSPKLDAADRDPTSADTAVVSSQPSEGSESASPSGNKKPTDVAGNISPPPYYAIEARTADEDSRRPARR